MNQLDAIKVIAEFVKQSIDNNPSFLEWEKWWRKCGVNETVELAKKLFSQQNSNIELHNTKED